MGCDIHGFIEVVGVEFRDTKIWDGLVKIEYLTGRNYLFFAKIFGVRNDGSVAPLAHSRGIPLDASTETKIAYSGLTVDENGKVGATCYELLKDERLTGTLHPSRVEGYNDFHSPSWVLARDILNTTTNSWDDHELEDQSFPHIAVTRRYLGTTAESPASRDDIDSFDPRSYLYRRWLDRKGRRPFDTLRQIGQTLEVPSVETGLEYDLVFTAEPWTWSLVVNESWSRLTKMLRLLIEEYGEENVRLVVWFDS